MSFSVHVVASYRHILQTKIYLILEDSDFNHLRGTYLLILVFKAFYGRVLDASVLQHSCHEFTNFTLQTKHAHGEAFLIIWSIL